MCSHRFRKPGNFILTFGSFEKQRARRLPHAPLHVLCDSGYVNSDKDQKWEEVNLTCKTAVRIVWIGQEYLCTFAYAKHTQIADAVSISLCVKKHFWSKLWSVFICLCLSPQRPSNPNPNPVRKNHACETCGKAFRDVYHLNRHRLSHSDEKPFSCPICQQRFKRKDRMSHHVRSHQGGVEKPYVCPHCGKAFSRWHCGTAHLFFFCVNWAVALSCASML